MIAFLPFEPDLLKDAEISNVLERHLWNGAEILALLPLPLAGYHLCLAMKLAINLLKTLIHFF